MKCMKFTQPFLITLALLGTFQFFRLYQMLG